MFNKEQYILLRRFAEFASYILTCTIYLLYKCIYLYSTFTYTGTKTTSAIITHAQTDAHIHT